MLLSKQPENAIEQAAIERESWIRHKENMVLFHDYTGLFGQEAIDICEYLSERVRERGLMNISLLIDVTDGQADRETLAVFKREAAANKAYYGKIAVIGVEGLLAFFFEVVKNFSGVNARAFKTKAAALDWLVEE